MTKQDLLNLIDLAADEGWEELDLRDQEIAELPPEIGKLQQLKRLRIGRKEWWGGERNPLTILPAEIGQLVNLEILDLKVNQITAIPPTIGYLTNLTRIDLSNNRLKTIPTEIKQLINLTEFSLSRNHLTAVPSEIWQLNNLVELSLSRNALIDISPKIKQLTCLIELYLGGNWLTTIPPEIGQLTDLSELYVWGNKLKNIPPEIGLLTNLKELYLWGNQLTAIPSEIGQLNSLTLLDLTDNELRIIPREIERLTNLTRLYLFNNQLTGLPNEIRPLKKLTKLGLHGNPLPLSPEILQKTDDPAFILESYFSSVRPLHEVKLLLVGEGEVGKTSLAHQLMHRTLPTRPGKTAGIDIHPWHLPLTPPSSLLSPPSSPLPPPPPIRLNLWDFGGQEIYHATHQFFLTTRSLYLVVLTARQGEQEGRLHYWLSLVGSLSHNAPVIVVVNKTDEHPAFRLDERGLMAKYPAIVGFAYTACTTGQGIEPLQQTITETLATMPHIHDRIPQTWFTLREKLEQMPEDYIPYEQYETFCQQSGIQHSQDTLLQVLHDLGIVLNFQEDHRLSETFVLKPEWVTKGVYAILNAKEQGRDGLVTLDDVAAILRQVGRYPRHKLAYIMDLMHTFGLCYQHSDHPPRYLIPDHLPKSQPDLAWAQQEGITFELHYSDILPASILPALMVRLNKHLDWQRSWRNGAVLAREENTALVQTDSEARKLFIRVMGYTPARRTLLNGIRLELDEIHDRFPNLAVQERVPLPGYPGRTVSYAALLNHEKRGRPYYDGELDAEFEVRQLLDGIETPEMRQERQLLNALVELDLEGIKQLCFDLDVDHEEWAGGKTAKARELVLHMKRHKRLEELESFVRKRQR